MKTLILLFLSLPAWATSYTFNTGNGVWIRGWDGFLLDNWLSGNGEAGYGAYEENLSITMTGNPRCSRYCLKKGTSKALVSQ